MAHLDASGQAGCRVAAKPLDDALGLLRREGITAGACVRVLQDVAPIRVRVMIPHANVEVDFARVDSRCGRTRGGGGHRLWSRRGVEAADLNATMGGRTPPAPGSPAPPRVSGVVHRDCMRMPHMRVRVYACSCVLALPVLALLLACLAKVYVGALLALIAEPRELKGPALAAAHTAVPEGCPVLHCGVCGDDIQTPVDAQQQMRGIVASRPGRGRQRPQRNALLANVKVAAHGAPGGSQHRESARERGLRPEKCDERTLSRSYR
jgi:hypothetical protein